MTGSTSRFKLVDSAGMGDLSFEQALERCKHRSVVWPSGKRGEAVPLDACVVLLGQPAPLNRELVERLGADVAQGKTFMIAAENQESLNHALRIVDQLALAIMRPAGTA
jgi:hypothetical protein